MPGQQTYYRLIMLILSAWFLGPAYLPAAANDVDVQGIIRHSYNFLLNREPEMTDTEYAIYEQILPMVFDQTDVAITLLETMLADDEPESPAFSYVLANVYFSSERYELAEKHYKSAIENYPEFLRAWVNLGILHYTVEDYPQAITCFTKAMSLGNRDPQIIGLLGYCLKESNNPLAAEAAFQQAFTGDPHNSDWIEALLDLYLDSKQYQRAELLARELIKLKPESKSYWKAYTSLLLSTERKTEAITALEILHNLDLADASDMLLLGDLYAEHGLFPEALATYQEVIQRSAVSGADHILRYARSLVYQESYDKVERLLAALHGRISPQQQMEAQVIRADLHRARGELDKALAVLDGVLQADPMNGQALLGMGRIYSRRKEFERAQFLLEQAHAIPECTFQASIELANIALTEHRYRKGIQYLRNALDIEYHPEIESHISRLEAMDSPLP